MHAGKGQKGQSKSTRDSPEHKIQRTMEDELMDDTAPGVIPDLEPFLPEFPPPLFTGAAASSGAGLQTTATPEL